ncbi:CSTF1 [Symbiodinium sp. KB8]|nr:CSTF1 [Symbiodinium sp. KB8]
MQATAPRHDNTMLYAEILDLVATICARGSLQTASLVCQKLLSHSNQWFNWSFLLDTLMQHARLPQSTGGGSGPSAGDAMVMALCRLVSGACGGRLLVMQPTMQPIANSLNSGVASSLGDPWGRAENLAGILVDVLSAHPEPAVKAACLGALGNLDLPPPQVSRNIISSILMAVPSLVPFVEHPRVCDGAVAIELLACVIRFLQAIPISKGRYGLDLQPLTHVVIHQVLLKALAEPSAFRSSSRYWRLAALTLRWLRLVLRGPLPMSTSSSLNALIVRPYSDSDSTAAEVSMRCAAGNATAYAFRCLLSLDSPVFARVLYLTTLQGHAMDGLANGRRAGASQAYLEQCARHGLDVVRILLQRDVLFSRLHAQNTSERALSSMWSGAAFLQDGPILPTHRLLLAEFAFTYPPGGSGRSSSFSAFNPFWSQRPHFEQTESPDASAGSRRHNPSYLALLSEFVGVRSHNGIGRLALFVFMQCSYREPQRVLRLLQLEPWRLVALSAALYDRIVEPDEGEACKEALAAAKSQGKTWDKSTEAYFMHEAMEIDASPDFCHLDVTSFETALPLCRAVDLLQQLAEDSVVQAADISVWARGSSAEGSDAGASSLRGCASSDASLFRAAYLRGFDIPAHWLSHGATSLMAVIQNENTVQLPFAALAAESSRSLTLRFFLLLLGDTTTDSSAPSQSLAQLLLGLDPSGESSGFVDIDQARAGNPSALDALMLLLENPPSLPAWIDSGAPRSSSRALQPRSATQPEIQEAIRNHSAYEASLSVVLSLLAMPALRDVVLRYMCHAWTSRYRVLKSLLAVSWSSLATSLQRILLSEAALILQVCAWEMRLVWPSGRPPMEHLDTTADILGQQRLDMKMNVSEHLQEVVCDLISHGDSGLSGHTSMPYLVNAALRLADACDVVDAVVGSAALQGSDSVLFGRDAMQDQLRASTCQCMAPAKAGGALSRKLELQDPHLLLHLSGLSYLLSATEAEGDRSRFAADLQLLCSRNEYACIAYYTECACNGLTTFVSAALSHLVGRPRAMIGSTESDSRAQAARAHLEALLPAMAAEEAGAEAPRRLELLSGLATAFLAAMIERSKAPPLAFVRRVYVLLSGALVRPLAVSRESRRNLQEALLVLLQRMLPDQALDVAMGFQVPDLEAEDATELARLVSSLMAAEMAEAEHVAESDPSSNGPGVSLPLLCALMTRVPARQLSTVFSGLWRQLTELIQAGSQASLRDANCLRHLHGSALAAILCQSPESASAFFEAGGLSAVLRPEMLQGRLRLAPAGLHALDTVHPAALVSVLQVLVAMLGVLPTHNLVLQSALQWLERHLQPLLDVMQWVTRLPFTTASEPRARAVGASPSSVVAALAARTGRSAGREGPDAMLVVCRSLETPQTTSTTRDLCVDGLAFWLSGRCSMSSGSSVAGDDKYADGIALCHRCLALFVELWSLVHLSVARRRKYAAGKADVYQAQLQKLEPMIHAALPGLLMQVASASAPDPDSMSDADGSAGNTMLLEALRPAEVTQHRIISNILQIWRYDSITQHIKMLASKNPQAQPSAQSAWSLWQQVQQTGPFQQVTQGSGMSQSILGEVKVRSGVLCAVFVHACCKLLSLRLSDPLPVRSEGGTLASLEATVDGQGGHGEQLHFDGAPATFTQLLYVVEMSLHLLCLHLMLLTTVADLDGAPTVSAQTPPTPGPRLAIVGQYLRLLIEFATASGGSVALLARCPKACDLPKTVSNLAFAASAASAAPWRKSWTTVDGIKYQSCITHNRKYTIIPIV